MENPIKENLEQIIDELRRTKNVNRIRSLEAKLLRYIKKSGSPIIRGNNAHFFFIAKEERKISLVGDWNKWNSNADMFRRLNPSAAIYYCNAQFPIDAGLPYRIVVGDESFHDPLNKKILNGPLGSNSYFGMPAYRDVEYWGEPSTDVSKGKLRSFIVTGNSEVASREIQVYIPNGLKLRGVQRVLYMNDGAEAITMGKCTNVLDNLYHYEPLRCKIIVVFVPPADRNKEYMLSDAFSRWFANDLTRQVERKLGITSRANLRAIQGASLGGLLSAHIGLNHFKKFGNIAAQSPSFWVSDFAIVGQYAKSKLLPLRFFLHTGTINDASEGAEAMLSVLQEKEYEVTYRESNESHNWANWASKYAEIIRWAAQ